MRFHAVAHRVVGHLQTVARLPALMRWMFSATMATA